MITNRSVAPATEPVTLAELKSHLGVTISDDDTRLTDLIEVARQQAEDYARCSFITQTWQAKLDDFPAGDVIDLPFAPIQSVTTVAYIDENGDNQTFTDYTLDIPGKRIHLQYGYDWPSTRAIQNAVTITYVAGYGAASAVPEGVKSAVKLLAEIQYDRPDAAYSALLQLAAYTLLNGVKDYRSFRDG